MSRRHKKVSFGSALVLALMATFVPLQSAAAAQPQAIAGAQAQQETVLSDRVAQARCSGCGYGTKVTKLSSTKVYGRHAKNLTGSWAKASQYTWGSTTTATASLTSSVGLSVKQVSSSIGATYSTSRAYSVTTTIPANKSKYSKLALKANYNKIKVRVTKTNAGITTYNKTSYLYSPIKGSPTLYVNYK